MVAFGPRIDYTITVINKDPSGKFLIIELQINKFHLILVVLYGQNTDCPKFQDNIKDLLTNKENSPLLNCGDWNLVINFNLILPVISETILQNLNVK